MGYIIRYPILMLISLIFNGCVLTNFIPHSYQSINTTTWEKVTFDPYKVSMDLPKDQHDYFHWYYHNPNEIRMSIYRIVPNTIWEPMTFASLKFEIEDKDGGKYGFSPEINDFQGSKGVAYKYCRYNGLAYDCVMDINDRQFLDCHLELWGIKSNGYFYYYYHDRKLFSKTDELYKRVLSSLRYDGQPILKAKGPEDIKLNNVIAGEFPVGYEELYKAVFGNSNEIKKIPETIIHYGK